MKTYLVIGICDDKVAEFLKTRTEEEVKVIDITCRHLTGGLQAAALLLNAQFVGVDLVPANKKAYRVFVESMYGKDAVLDFRFYSYDAVEAWWKGWSGKKQFLADVKKQRRELKKLHAAKAAKAKAAEERRAEMAGATHMAAMRNQAK